MRDVGETTMKILKDDAALRAKVRDLESRLSVARAEAEALRAARDAAIKISVWGRSRLDATASS